MIDSNREILESISKDNELAFKQLYDIYHQKVYAVGYHLTQSKTIAQDITQDVFVKIWNKRHELHKVTHFDGWLKTVVKNHAYNILSKAAKESSYYQVPEVYFIDNTVEEKEKFEIVEKAISSLPPQQKKVFILSRREGIKIDRIAEVMSLSPNTVKNHLKAASASIIAFLQKNIDIIIFMAFVAEKYCPLCFDHTSL